MSTPRSGGRILARALEIQGCEAVFCVPGESFLALLDGLRDSAQIRTVTCRQEGGAAMMAEAWGKLTGRPGVCVVTRGPGAANAAAGVHVAFQDSTPMLLVVGQVPRRFRDREAFQEVDLRRMYGALAKRVEQVDEAARLPEYLGRAWHWALAGRPGPVVLAVPEDVLGETATVADLPPVTRALEAPAPAEIEALAWRLERAERPLVLAGGGGWTAAASADLQRFAEANVLPVCAAFRCQDYLDNDSPAYVGHAGIGIDAALARRIRHCDLLLAVGARLGEIATQGYTLLEAPEPHTALVHVHPGAEELGRVYRPAQAIRAAAPAFLEAVAHLAVPGRARRQAWAQAARADFEASQVPLATPGALRLEEVIAYLRDRLPPDAIVTNGAGNYTAWLHRYHRYRRFRSQLAPTSGSMGYGLPAAVAAALRHPDRAVLAFAGDGCFLMTGQELATAVALRARLTVIVVNNGLYGTIRMHQERRYPGRPHATDLVNPDFAALARSFGAQGFRAETTQAFVEAFEASRGADGPVLIEALTDPRAVTPTATLDGLARSA